MPKKQRSAQSVTRIISIFFLILGAAALGACAATSPRPEPTPEVPREPPTRPAPEATRLPLVPVLDPPAMARVDRAPENLWERLRGSFAMPSCEAVPRAMAWAHWYAGRQEYLDRVTERAEPILYFIVEEIETRGMPGELALLPVVESAFQPFALSHASAAGLWQFIPATGERYGLKQTWWYDGRRDIYAATHAAMDYLEFLAAMFDGDYLLALAAYNSGEKRVKRLRDVSLARGGSGDFAAIAGALPRETRSYVPKLVGLACLAADPQRFGIHLRPIVNEPRFMVVETGTQIDLALAAHLAEMDIEDLYLLNPAFNRWATDPAGPHRLLLPTEKVSVFRANLAQIPRDSRVQWARHTVQRGETLSGIGRQYRVSVSDVMRVNELSSSLIRPGQHLLVPSASASDDPRLLAHARKLSELQSQLGVGASRQYRVRSGDTLWAISRRHDISVSQLAQANGIRSGDVLRIGQQLVIPGAGSRMLAAGSSPGRPTKYTVRRGDSLWEIARRFRVDLDDLKRWNGMGGSTLLHPGQSLRLLPQ